MKVFLTGNRGRIGSFVERQLREDGHEVVGFDIAIRGDILDADAVARAMVGCDGIAHLVMLMGRDYPRDQVFASGTVGNWNVLDAAEKEGVNRLVSCSSVSAIGLFMGECELDSIPFAEEHACRPGRPYATSKYVGEQMCRLFTERTGISKVCMRPPTVLSDERVASMRRARRSGVDPLLGIWLLHTRRRLGACHGVFIDLSLLEHEVQLVVAEDISSRAMSSQE